MAYVPISVNCELVQCKANPIPRNSEYTERHTAVKQDIRQLASDHASPSGNKFIDSSKTLGRNTVKETL